MSGDPPAEMKPSGAGVVRCCDGGVLCDAAVVVAVKISGMQWSKCSAVCLFLGGWMSKCCGFGDGLLWIWKWNAEWISKFVM